MKLIKCIIQPHKVDEVVEKLETMVAGMTVSEVRRAIRLKTRVRIAVKARDYMPDREIHPHR